MKVRIVISFLLFILAHSIVCSQESVSYNHKNGLHGGMKGSHRLTIGLGHTHVSEGIKNGKREWLIIPSWSLNYDYWIKDQLGIGLQSDLILETFIIEDHEQELIERSRPISLVPVVIYKPFNRWAFVGSIGGEFTKEQNLALTSLGVEYGVHFA